MVSHGGGGGGGPGRGGHGVLGRGGRSLALALPIGAFALYSVWVLNDR